MKVFKAGVVYFALVFGAGFLLGAIRVPFVVPRLGQRTAELIEEPIMLVVIVLAARWTVNRRGVSVALARLGMGLIGLALLAGAELGVVLGLQRLSLAQYIAGRDPVAGTIYVAMLGIFAIMPLLLMWLRIR